MDKKPLRFRGSSLDDIRGFPDDVRQDAGHQLYQVQIGREPEDFKSMKTVGPGACEIRVSDETGAYRVIYVAKFELAVYVLHCFKKKSQKTRMEDINLAKSRYRELLQELER